MSPRTRALTPICLVGIALLAGLTSAQELLVLHLTDYATMPVTGLPTGSGNAGSLARVNFLREEPGDTGRLFVNDLNGPLYILDKRTRTFTTYLDFNGRDDRPGLFDKLPFAAGYANGLISFQFDPDYSRNGTFYTIHLEEPAAVGSSQPDGTSVPGLSLEGYSVTTPIRTPGAVEREAMLIAWTDTRVANTEFEGTARELMRVELNTRIHPMGDLIFNPTARPGDPDWRLMYIASGDGGSGEQHTPSRLNPQRLDTLVGKILRIVPDLSLHTAASTVSENGRYRIPRDNPFVAVDGARREVWAYGLRNPHRLTWDVDPVDRARSRLLAASIGLHARETVSMIRKGQNYGYPEREGTARLRADNSIAPLPGIDVIPVRVSDEVTVGTMTPTYPVLEYPHTSAGGDAIAGGFVYRGEALPALEGKYVFGDITTGRMWYADYEDMLAADDGKPETLAGFREIRLKWTDPAGVEQVYPTMFEVVRASYTARGGTDLDLPGTSTVSGPGRADIRLAVDAAGELYILSKVDGMIRAVVGAGAR